MHVAVLVAEVRDGLNLTGRHITVVPDEGVLVSREVGQGNSASTKIPIGASDGFIRDVIDKVSVRLGMTAVGVVQIAIRTVVRTKDDALQTTVRSRSRYHNERHFRFSRSIPVSKTGNISLHLFGKAVKNPSSNVPFFQAQIPRHKTSHRSQL